MAHKSSTERTIERLREALANAEKQITAMQSGVQSHLDNEQPKPATEPTETEPEGG